MDKSKKTKLGSKSEKEMEIEKKAFKTTSEKEQEIDKLLTEEEELEANYKRLRKQGMSDQIANREQLKALAKDVYEGAKSGAKKIAKKVKGKVSELLKKDK